MAESGSRKTVRLGVFVPLTAQFLDTACVDVLASMSYEYLSLLEGLAPPPIVKLAPSVKISYISSVPAGQLTELTASLKIQCTHSLSDPEVQPGKLDILLVPGPDPRSTYEKPTLDFLAAHAANPNTDILSVCTGIYMCGEAGLLRGKKVCGPRGLQSQLKAKFEGATWLGHELRWIQDGNFWSCGGVTNGNDLVSAYARQSPHFPGPVAEFGIAISETGDRPQRYEKSQTATTLGIVWQVLKAVFMGFGKGKQE